MPPQSLLRKQIKTKLMLCMPLFIVHVRVKGLLSCRGIGTGPADPAAAGPKFQ